jgi:ankyrin repeat domain-containing protein 50
MNTAFNEALSRHIAKLSAEERTSFQNAHPQISAEELLARVKDFDKKHSQTAARRCFTKSERFLRVLDSLMRGVVIAIQCHPEISSIIVGGARLVLDLSLKFVEFFSRLTDMLDRLSDHLEHLQKFAESTDKLIHNSVADCYGDVLGFYQEACNTFQKKKRRLGASLSTRRFLRNSWEPFQKNFGQIDDSLKNHLLALQLSSQAVIHERVEKIGTLTIPDKRKGFLAWISQYDFNETRADILRRRCPGTGDWLCQHDDFQRWSSSHDSAVLWCYGPPGVGKTMLTSVVIEGLKMKPSTTSPYGLTCAYFSYKNLDRQHPSKIMAALLKQLAQQVTHIPQQLLIWQSDHERNDTSPLYDEIIQKFMVIAREFDRVYIILDGLDEVEAEKREDILDFVWTAKSELPCAKSFIASRAEPDIALAFKSSTGTIQIPIRAANVHDDIAQYINIRLDELLKPVTGDGRIKGQLRIQDPAEGENISGTHQPCKWNVPLG